MNVKLKSLFYIIVLIALFVLFNQAEPNFLLKFTNKSSAPLPTEVHPIVKERALELIQQTASKGIVIVITDDFRDSHDQDLLYEKGRSAAGSIVTYAKGGESFHNYGLAIDFAIKAPSGDILWDMTYDGNQNGKADWDEVVELAKNLGFEWGGDWAQFKDYPHLQMNFGLTIADLQNGERPLDSAITAEGN